MEAGFKLPNNIKLFILYSHLVKLLTTTFFASTNFWARSLIPFYLWKFFTRSQVKNISLELIINCYKLNHVSRPCWHPWLFAGDHFVMIYILVGRDLSSLLSAKHRIWCSLNVNLQWPLGGNLGLTYHREVHSYHPTSSWKEWCNVES